MSKGKYIEENIVKGITQLLTAVIAIVLFSIIWGIFAKGLPALSWQMLTDVPHGGYYFGKEDGIR
ncbi:hypothetical protein, partial [Flavobacterium rhizosphaerae]